MKNWLVATYKLKEVNRLKINLLNQNFNFYIPKITIKKINSNPKEELLFPGYVFIETCLEKYSAIKYTKGIKNILKFGDNISHISEEDIKSIQVIEESSKINPIFSQIKVGQEAIISKGSFKGSVVKICSLQSRERVTVLLNFLGSSRRVSVPEKSLIFEH